MERKYTITNETILYGLILIAALFVRLFLLGRVPLGEMEASWAIQAWQSALGESAVLGSQVGYLAFSSFLFRMFGGSDFLARLWPALTGALLIGVPVALRKELGLFPALVMAGGLALDPALVSASRTVGNSLPALVFLSLALVYFHNYRLTWSAFFLGLGLLSGQGFWLGILILLISVFAANRAGLIAPLDYFRERFSTYKKESGGNLVGFLLPVLLLVLIGSSFLTEWMGLTAWVSALPEFLSSWLKPGGLSFSKLLIILVLSNPFALVFGLVGFTRAWRTDDRLGKFLAIFWAASLVVVFLYPGRQGDVLIWSALPLWGGAALEIVRVFTSAKSVWATYLVAGLAAVLVSLNWLTMIGMVFQVGNDKAILLQLGLLAASTALVVLSFIVVSGEWNKGTAWKGLAIGVGLVLLLFMISSLTLDGFLWEKDPRSLYTSSSGPGQMDLLRDSISGASLTATGRSDSIQGVVLAKSPSLRWYLKDYPAFEFADSIEGGNPPPVLITSEEDQSWAENEVYRGQDFVLSSHLGWNGPVPEDWISWMAFRFGPVQRDHIILWVRNDINSGY